MWMRNIHRDASLPLLLSVAVFGDPPLQATLRMSEKSSRTEYQFDLLASPASITFPPSHDVLFLDLSFLLAGESERPYHLQVDISQSERSIASFTLQGTPSASPTLVREVLMVTPQKD